MLNGKTLTILFKLCRDNLVSLAKDCSSVSHSGNSNLHGIRPICPAI